MCQAPCCVLDSHTGMNKTDLAPIFMGSVVARKEVYLAQGWGAMGTHSRNTYSGLKARQGQLDMRLAKKGKVF